MQLCQCEKTILIVPLHSGIVLLCLAACTADSNVGELLRLNCSKSAPGLVVAAPIRRRGRSRADALADQEEDVLLQRASDAGVCEPLYTVSACCSPSFYRNEQEALHTLNSPPVGSFNQRNGAWV